MTSKLFFGVLIFTILKQQMVPLGQFYGVIALLDSKDTQD